MKRFESVPLLTHFRMGVHSANYSALAGAGDNSPPQVLPQHQVFFLKGFNCVGCA